MTKLLVVTVACCFVLLLLNGVAESRRHHHGDDAPPAKPKDKTRKLFVFGDDFADTGNSDDSDRPGQAYRSRAWRYPFGVSDTAHGKQPSGRFSDGLVQSDFMAKIMGHSEAPPPYSYDSWDDGIDDAGLNFAVGDSGALEAPEGVLKLSAQVQQLRNLLRDGLAERRDLTDSVALVAYSGNDYAAANDTNTDDLVARVVEELGSVVSQLQDLGVSKVVVNTVPPFGCSPWMAKASNYSSCDDHGNVASDKHNTALRDRLAGDDDGDVMLLDVNSIITDLVVPKEGSALFDKQFTERLRPCCEATGGDDSYCGLDGGFSLCDRPQDYFFWDDVHPTHAGWRAVMQLLQGPIMSFLGISNLEHF